MTKILYLLKQADVSETLILMSSFAFIIVPKLWLSVTYKPLLWLLLIGAILPLPFWLLYKRYPNTAWLKYVHIPIMALPAAYWITHTSSETFTWLLFGLLFHLLIRRWWYDRYSLLFSAAMDTGSQISATIFFFTFYNRTVRFPDWWGSRIKDNCALANHSEFRYSTGRSSD